MQDRKILVYLIDDRGEDGEYLGFLRAYRRQLPFHEIQVFTHWEVLLEAVKVREPDLLLADMRFDLIPREELYGDIEALAQSEHFCGNVERAEVQVRGMQGLLICRGLRELGYRMPVILFASLEPRVMERVTGTLAPIRIIEGLMLDRIQEAMGDLLGKEGTE